VTSASKTIFYYIIQLASLTSNLLCCCP